jgi:membrane protease YdiL (CAAX protease family)
MRTRVIQTTKIQPNRRQHDQAVTERAPKQHHGRVASLIDRHPLSAFFVIAFALTWVTVPVGTFMAAGPLIASLIVLGVTGGRAGIRALGRRMVQWRVRWPYYVAALLVPISVGLAAGGGDVAFGASDAAFANLEVSALLLAFALRMVVPMFAPLGEEPGWRGFALPRMQRVRTPFAATLLLGVIVAAWHAPLLIMSSVKFEPVMLLGTVAVTFWYTWLFNRTGGSVFMTMVAHAADGIIGEKLLADGGFHGAAERRFAVIYCAAWLVVAVVLVLADRRRWFSPVTDAALVEAEPVRNRGRVVVRGSVALTVMATVLVVGLAGVASAKSPDRDTYIERADAICSTTVEKTDAIVEDAGFTPSDEEARVAGREVVALARAELRQLRALPAPAHDSAKLAAIFRAVERGWDRVEEKPSVLFDEPGPLTKARRLASAYGLEVCGRA